MNIVFSLREGMIFMRLSVIEMDADEGIFYNLGVFKKYEDLIVLPYILSLNFSMKKWNLEQDA